MLKNKIPKIIHQIYWDFSFKGKPIRDEWKKASLTWVKHHPKWEHKIWDDKDCLNLIKNDFPWFLETYLGYKYEIQRCDSVRPLILYKYGGLYIDMDTICLKPFDNILTEEKIYLVKSPHNFIKNSVGNGVIASPKNNNILLEIVKKMIKSREKKFYHNHHIYIMNSTGPLLYSKFYKKYKNKIILLPSERFNSCSVCEKKCKLKKDLYCYTIYSSSWAKNDTLILNYIFCNKNLIFLVLLFSLILILNYINRKITYL